MDILVIDDEILVRMGLKSIFSGYSDEFRILEAGNGKQAMELYALHKPPLVLVDITMPVMDGMEFIAEAKKLDYSTKFVILTCHDEFDLARKAIKLGVSDYIVKTSINEKELLSIAREIKKESSKEADEKIGREFPNEFAKQNILRNIIMGKVPDKELLMALLDKYEMKFLLRPEAFLLFPCDKPDALKIVEEMLHEYLGGMMLELDRGLVLVLLVLPDSSDKLEQNGFIEEFCERLVKSFEMYYNTDLSIGVCMCDNVEDVCCSVKKTEKALQSRFYFEGSGFSFFYKPAIPGIKTEKLEEYRDGIAQYLQNMEYVEAMLRLENFVFKMESQKPENVSDITNVFIQLYYIFTQHIRQRYPDINDEAIEQFRSSGRFNSTGNLFHFFRLFKQILEKLNDLLNRDMASYHSKIIFKAQQYIMEHLDEETDLDAIAKHVNLSSSYFSELFKEKTGQKFIDYITGVKMDKALELLQRGEKVYSIMEKLGYNNHSYFCRLFKKVTGKNLREFKQKG